MAEKTKYVDDEDSVDVATTPTNSGRDEMDVEFGDENVMASTGLQKIIPDKGKASRVALLTDMLGPKKAFVHFIAEKGSYLCLSTRDPKGNIVGKPAICCQKTANDDKAKAQLIVAVLAFLYTNTLKDGKYPKVDPPAIEWEIRWLKLSRSGFAKVSKLPDEDSPHHMMDFIVSWRVGNVGFEYNRATSHARFRQNPQLVEEVKLAAEPYLENKGKLLIDRLGKKITEPEMAALFAGKAAANASSASIEDVDDI